MGKLYILNEKSFIREILASGKKPDGVSNGYLISLIAKYYYDDEQDLENLIRIVKDKMLKLNIPNYQEYLYHKIIKSCCEGLYDINPNEFFKELDYIPIYENELKVVESIPNDRQKKFMFTLFALARYMNCDGWVNKKSMDGLSEIFKIANISSSTQLRNSILNGLVERGYITFAKMIDNMNIHVDLDDSGEIVYKVTSFENLGNQYMSTFKKGYKRCQNCGCLIKGGGNKKKYCDKCAVMIEKQNATIRKRKQREKSKCHEIEILKNIGKPDEKQVFFSKK